jgi:phage gp36-like protein
MPATLTESQLKSALTNEQITRSKTKMGEGETLDPVAEEISAALAKVDTYTTGYEVPESLLTGWARDIAAFHVAKRLDTPTDYQIKAYERALKELEDIRDGKFPNLTKIPGATEGKVKHGTRPKVL